MLKFTSPSGTLIVDKCQTNFDTVFKTLFGSDEDEYDPVDVHIVKASPGLLAPEKA